MMTSAMASQYIKRWAAVREVETRELRALSFRQKFSQLENLAQFARYLRSIRKFKPLAIEQDALQTVRDRWVKLRRLSIHA